MGWAPIKIMIESRQKARRKENAVKLNGIEEYDGLRRISYVYACAFVSVFFYIFYFICMKHCAECLEISSHLARFAESKNYFENFIAFENIYEVMLYVCRAKCPRSVNFKSVSLCLSQFLRNCTKFSVRRSAQFLTLMSRTRLAFRKIHMIEFAREDTLLHRMFLQLNGGRNSSF